LQACVQGAAHAGWPAANLTWIPDAFLLANDAGPWGELPLWIPESSADMAGFLQVDCSKAIAAGLSTRPVADTIADVLAYLQTRGKDVPLKAGMKADKEASLLVLWKASNS
jgi:2'-hydroxyisoflavone reductase